MTDIPVAGPCTDATKRPGPKSIKAATNFSRIEPISSDALIQLYIINHYPLKHGLRQFLMTGVF